MFFAIICGGIFFSEFEKFGVGQMCGFVAGLLMVLVGVYGLAPTDVNIATVDEVPAKELSQDEASLLEAGAVVRDSTTEQAKLLPPEGP